jgi:hypothetical protein
MGFGIAGTANAGLYHNVMIKTYPGDRSYAVGEPGRVALCRYDASSPGWKSSNYQARAGTTVKVAYFQNLNCAGSFKSAVKTAPPKEDTLVNFWFDVPPGSRK